MTFDTGKKIADLASFGAIAGSATSLITPISSVIATIYLCVRLLETDTAKAVIRWVRNKWRGYIP